VSLDKWDERFLRVVDEVASWSKDRSTKVGCVIVRADRTIAATGYNGFPRGVDDDVDERHERPGKYLWTEHAERNALYQAAKHGVNLAGATLYMRWFPCADCARAMVQVGIRRFVGKAPTAADARWAESQAVAALIITEAGIEVVHA
jgi:dCMP deaminase